MYSGLSKAPRKFCVSGTRGTLFLTSRRAGPKNAFENWWKSVKFAFGLEFLYNLTYGFRRLKKVVWTTPVHQNSEAHIWHRKTYMYILWENTIKLGGGARPKNRYFDTGSFGWNSSKKRHIFQKPNPEPRNPGKKLFHSKCAKFRIWKKLTKTH